MSLFTPRISPDALRGTPPQLGGIVGPQGPILVATGAVTFDMTLDAATINAGGSKPVVWYSGVPANIITPGPLSAFAVYLQGVATTTAIPPVKQMYDRCAEVRLVSSPGGVLGNDVATAWIWDAFLPMQEFHYVIGQQSYGLLMGYEGSPIAPNVLVRSGMVSGVTAATMAVKYTFGLYMLPLASFGANRCYVPSPWSVPPFVSHGSGMGTHLFSQHATNNAPLCQASNSQRIFRPLVWPTPQASNGSAVHLMVDARMFGGPWNVHVLGVKPLSDPAGCTWDVEEMLRSQNIVLPNYSPPVLASANNAASIYSPRPIDVARVTLEAPTGSNPRTEVLLTYPD